MPNAEPLPRPRGPLSRLGVRVALAIVAALALLAAVLFAYVAPRAEATFLEQGNLLIEHGTTTMRDLARRQTEASSTVLVDLIQHTAAARAMALQDLPLELCGGDLAAIRTTIATEDARRSERQQRNVGVLAGEMQRRADAHIDQRLQALADRQRELTRRFADELRMLHLTLVAAGLLVLVTILGLGVQHFVVRPTKRLRRASQRVAAGDLDVVLPPASHDEVGLLTVDFAAMVAQLRTSRTAVQQLTDGLEREVQNKTAHLERALADLAASHQQLAARERLASLGTLAGGIAHEFHNVIGGIRGCAAELLADETVADRRETLGVITRAADRATGIVHQLLRFARHSVENRTDLDLAVVVDDALRLCEPAARRQAVRVERELAPGIALRGDADALHQVVVNLLTNALQAMPDGGTLHVTVARRGADAAITVRDSGHGIAAADLPHIFEPFFSNRGHGERGTGLGLSVSYGIVTAHGGSIEVASPPGQGASFTVLLPLPGTVFAAPQAGDAKR